VKCVKNYHFHFKLQHFALQKFGFSDVLYHSTETVFLSNNLSFLFLFICPSVFSHIVDLSSLMLCGLIQCLVFPAYEMISVTFPVHDRQLLHLWH
jgi:hypothetical protein